MAKAKLLLKNDVGLVLDITESPLGCTVYDLEGNEIGGGGSGGVELKTCAVHIINNTNIELLVELTPGILNGAIKQVNDPVPTGESDKVLIFNNNDPDPAICSVVFYDPTFQYTCTVASSDAVNCTVINNGGDQYGIALEITTTSDESSATLTVS